MSKQGHGREAARPQQLGTTGWRDVAHRVKARSQAHHLNMIAGGVTFFAFLAVFPALAAIVSLYGLFADPQDVEQQLMAIGEGMPEGVRDIFAQQMQQVAAGAPGTLGWGVALSLLITIWSANKGMKGMVNALNIAYAEDDDRGFIKKNLVTLGLTLAGLIAIMGAVALIVAVPILLEQVGLGAAAHTAVDLLRWPLLAVLMLGALTVLYRLGPARNMAQWRWVTPGSIVAVGLLLLVSIGFSIYVANFGNYNETYGSLGAVAVLLVWLYLSAYVILLGAEVNAEAERQTKRDTTVGPPEPMGKRRARSADTLGEARP